MDGPQDLWIKPEGGFKERKKFIEDPEFAGLQKDPEFQKIMESEPKVL